MEYLSSFLLPRKRSGFGKQHEVPADTKAEEYLDAYVTAAGIGDQAHSPLLFPTITHAREGTTGHESPRMTKLYDRTSDVITVGEVERIVI